MTDTELDEHGRREPPRAADESATLLGFLDYQRATLAWKCSKADDMIEEYARHNGDAALIRQSIDGATGE